MPGFRLEDGHERAEGNVVGSLFVSEPSFIAAPGQVIDSGLQDAISFESQNATSRLWRKAFAKRTYEPVESGSGLRCFYDGILPSRPFEVNTAAANPVAVDILKGLGGHYAPGFHLIALNETGVSGTIACGFPVS